MKKKDNSYNTKREHNRKGAVSNKGKDRYQIMAG